MEKQKIFLKYYRSMEGARNTSYNFSHFNPMNDGASRVSSQFCHDLIHYKKVLATERLKEIHEMNHFHTCGSKCVFQKRSDHLLLFLQRRRVSSFFIRKTLWFRLTICVFVSLC